MERMPNLKIGRSAGGMNAARRQTFGRNGAIAAAADPGKPWDMDFSRMISELRAEREQLEHAILAIERLARAGGKRRGRAPKGLASVTPKRRGRPAEGAC